jgi:hypothetical protein
VRVSVNFLCQLVGWMSIGSSGQSLFNIAVANLYSHDMKIHHEPNRIMVDPFRNKEACQGCMLIVSHASEYAQD